jgi:DNA gyrase subunit B
VFGDATFNYDTLQGRLRELAYLNKGLAITLCDERTGKKEEFKYDQGIAQFVEHLNKSETPLIPKAPPVYIEKMVPVEKGDKQEYVKVEVALQYTTGEEERVHCYTNSAYNPMGGTHLTGLRTALTRTLGNYGSKQNLFKADLKPIGEDFREGLTAVVSVQVAEPQFESQTKVRLNNPEVEGAVAGAIAEGLNKYLEEHPKEAQQIVKKVALAAEAREAAAKAKKAAKDRKSILNGGGLPGKLFDCATKDRDESELFLVEGDSAAGSAVDGRNSEFQAILPLRGKPLNVEKARLENMLKNEEITSLISAIGIDIGNREEGEETREKVRYGKVIIMTDADVDGKHIRTLLLTFFYRQMARLVAEGRIYVARPPLYKVTEKKNARFVLTDKEMNDQLRERGLKGTKLAIFPPPAPDGTQGEPRRVEGPDLARLLEVMARLEAPDGPLVSLERRGVSLPAFVARAGERGLPVFRVLVGGREEWCYTRDEAQAARRREQERLGRELVAGEDAGGNGHAADTFYEQELHEVREINRALEELKRFGLRPADLVPQPRIAGREPPVRLKLESGEHGKVLRDLRDLVGEVRRLGERGLSITRFKGLGEMDKDELWDTTLDPEKRILLRVQLEDAVKADEMFRTLMGEKVEPRRDFIYKHGIDAKDIDYHGA